MGQYFKLYRNFVWYFVQEKCAYLGLFFRNTKIISSTQLMEVLKVKATSTLELNNSQTKNNIELCVN